MRVDISVDANAGHEAEAQAGSVAELELEGDKPDWPAWADVPIEFLDWDVFDNRGELIPQAVEFPDLDSFDDESDPFLEGGA